MDKNALSQRANGEEQGGEPYALWSMPYALLFSGQGSQYAGMGTKLQLCRVGKETFQEASDTLGMDIAYLCSNGTNSDLADTEIAQPAILTCSIAAFRIWKQRGGTEGISFLPCATAGLSVGEYSALVASEVLSFTDALKLVKERGRLMAEAAAANSGKMVAILGHRSSKTLKPLNDLNDFNDFDDFDDFDDFNAIVGSICEEAGSFGVVWPANYNCPGQVVISGEERAVRRAVELAQKAGAKKCIALNVSGAFHSPLMRPAESGLRMALNSVPFSKPKTPFIANVTGDYVEGSDEIREMLALQLSNPIQWEASIRRMTNDGITAFVEVGPGRVLAGLVRRIYRQAEIFSTDDLISNE
jgi:[acyl-carrier-protein] S-malonyltransferase